MYIHEQLWAWAASNYEPGIQNVRIFTGNSEPGMQNLCIFTSKYEPAMQNVCIFASKTQPHTRHNSHQYAKVVKMYVFLRVPGRIYAYLLAN